MIDTADRLEIHEVLALYGHLIDQRRWSEMELVFHPEVVFDLTDFGERVFRSLDELRDYWSGPGVRHPVAHHATNIVISEDPDGTVRVLSKGFGVGRSGRIGSAVYDDIMVRTDGGWRLSYRRAQLRRADSRAG